MSWMRAERKAFMGTAQFGAFEAHSRLSRHCMHDSLDLFLWAADHSREKIPIRIDCSGGGIGAPAHVVFGGASSES